MSFVTESVTDVGIFFCVQGWLISQHWYVDQVGVCLVAGVDAGLGEQFCKGRGKNQNPASVKLNVGHYWLQSCNMRMCISTVACG